MTSELFVFLTSEFYVYNYELMSLNTLSSKIIGIVHTNTRIILTQEAHGTSSRQCHCPFDATSVVDGVLDIGYKKPQVYLVHFLFPGPESVLSPRSLVLWEMVCGDHSVIMLLLGPNPLAFPWLFILLVTFMPSVLLSVGFSCGCSSVFFPDVSFSIPKCEHFYYLLCFFSLGHSTCFYWFFASCLKANILLNIH